MTPEQAIAIANTMDVRDRFEIDEDQQPMSAELCHVEHLPDVDMPGVVENRIAWIVEMDCDWGWAKVYVEDSTGEILRVVHSS